MEINRSQQLWYWLNRFDRDESNEFNLLMLEQEQFPFFYLLNWNFNLGDKQLRKTALQSPIRSQFFHSHMNAPTITINFDLDASQNAIIDEFLTKMPSLTKVKKPIENDDLQDEKDLSVADWSPPVSETFAVILAKQQKYQSAINIYEQLSLAKPEKRLYFATRISELKQILNE